MASVSVFQFIRTCSSGFGKELVSHAYSEDRALFFQGFPYVSYRYFASVGIARPVRNKQPVVFDRVEVIIPGHSDDCDITFQKTPYYIVFYTAIDQHDSFLPVPVSNDFPGAYPCNLVDFIRVDKIDLIFIGKNDFTFHTPFLSQQFGEFPGIDSGDSGNLFLFQPLT